MIGTPGYMSPEQAAGKLEIGPATDVYSLGVILYEMLTGRVPIQGPTTLETLTLIQSEEPVPPRRLQPRLPRDLETICLRCLEKGPGRRYASAADLCEDLRRFLSDEPIKARPPSTLYRFAKFARRNKTLLGGVAGIARGAGRRPCLHSVLRLRGSSTAPCSSGKRCRGAARGVSRPDRCCDRRTPESRRIGCGPPPGRGPAEPARLGVAAPV